MLNVLEESCCTAKFGSQEEHMSADDQQGHHVYERHAIACGGGCIRHWNPEMVHWVAPDLVASTAQERIGDEQAILRHTYS